LLEVAEEKQIRFGEWQQEMQKQIPPLRCRMTTKSRAESSFERLHFGGEEFSVVFAGGGEDVEDFGGFEGGGLVGDVAVDDEAVAGVSVECSAVDFDADGSADDVDELVVRVAVAGAYPALVEVVADEHELVGVGEDLAAHTGLGGEGFGVLGFYEGHCGLRFLG
jgi:hypothetical protein